MRSKKNNGFRLLVVINDAKLIVDLQQKIFNLKLYQNYLVKVITLVDVALEAESEEKISCRSIDTYFFGDDHLLDYKEAIEVSSRWFFDVHGNDATLFYGISIGVILQRWLIKCFNSFISNVRTVERILEEECPDEIWLYCSKSGKELLTDDGSQFFMEIIASLAAQRGVTCETKVVSERPKENERVPFNKTVEKFFQKSKKFFYSLLIRRVLFFIKYSLSIWCGNRVNIVIPSPQASCYIGRAVIDRLLNDKRRNILIWGGETIRQGINLIDIPPAFMWRLSHYDEEVIIKVRRQFADFISSSSIEAIKGAPDVIMQVYRKQIEPLVRNIIFDIKKLEAFWGRVNVNLVFSHTDTTIKERTVVSVALRHSIPSIVLQHGAAGHYWGFFPLIATKFAAWGEITEEWFRKNGVPREKIVVTGAANFDAYLHRVNSNRGIKKAEWNRLSDYLLYVTVKGKKYATGFKHTEYDNVLLLNALLDTLETLPGKVLVIKLRPGDHQATFYASEIKRRGMRNVNLVEVTDNRRLLNACGLLITTYSTMAIEALFFEKPVIQLRFVNKKRLMSTLARQVILCDEDGIPLAKYGAAVGVENPEKLREAIVKIYEDEGLRHSIINNGKLFLKKYCHESDGKASLRVVECIDELVREVS